MVIYIFEDQKWLLYGIAACETPLLEPFIFKSAGEVTQELNPWGPPLFYCKRNLWGQTFRGLKPALQTETIISFPYHKTLQFNYIHRGPLAAEKLHLQRLKDVFYTPHLKGKCAGCFTPASFFSENLLRSSIIQRPSCVHSYNSGVLFVSDYSLRVPSRGF